MQRLAVVVVIVAALANYANGFCYRKNPPKSQESTEALQQPGNYSIWVCVQSKDFAGDLEKAPKRNITQVWMSMSQVPKLSNDQFAKFADKLIKIEIWGSKLAEIEDNAFRGLKELKGLILPQNELTSIKSVWFKDSSKLLELNLAFNRIQSVEIAFLKLVPALINLDLRGNELVSVPADFVKQLPASLRRLNLYNNPMNYKQTMEAVEWSKSKDDKANEPKLRELKHVFNVTRACIDDKAVEKTNEAVDKCVEDRLNNEILAAAAGIATVGSVATSAATTVTAAPSSTVVAATSTLPAAASTPASA
ncbi:uncharacterized protein LOC131664906 [Phymastichus coffea]|uniref:uncharacterized protein LOC131664906 n=1 Tax=Phymastichus coffea TaxID=108790 RepID=UPI00273C173E|nr:uncharacterized protein LOC131664906 [Phymastichus coffea]